MTQIIESDNLIYEYCDHCMVELHRDRHSGRLNNGVTCLFGVVLCKDCDAAIGRTKPRKQSMNLELRRYVRGVEKGTIKAPWTSIRIRNKNGNNMIAPIELTLDGKVKK